MLSTITDPSTETSAVVGTSCVHCGALVALAQTPDVPHDQVTGTADRFCCSGCEVAYFILQENDELKETWQARSRQSLRSTYTEMDHPAFQEKYVQFDSTAALGRVELAIENLYCASCVLAIEKLPRFLPGVREARVNLTTSRVSIVWQNDVVCLSSVAGTLSRLGHAPHPIDDGEMEVIDRQENRNRLIHLSIAAVCAGNAMLVAVAMYYGMFTGMESQYASLFRAVSALLALVSLSWPGASFFRNAIRAIRARTPHMDVPIAIGLTAGTAMGIANTVLGRGEVYFDSITVLVFLLLVGRYLQYHQQRKAVRQVSLINSLIPWAVHRIRYEADGVRIEIVPLEAVHPGDCLQVLIGDLIAADGVVLEGESTVDCSILTGESAGQPVRPGDLLSAGTTNLLAPLVMKVERVAMQTRLAEIARLVEAGLQSKTPIIQFANAVAGYFVIVVLTLAVVTFCFWARWDLELAVNHSMALLIVACPCALGLATPFTIAIAQARAARRQILIKSGDALEKLSRPGMLWLDKTGTMTAGQPKLIHWEGDNSCIPGVIALESHVIHPLARLLVDSLRSVSPLPEPHAVCSVAALPGLGVRGLVDGHEYLIGSHKLMTEYDLNISQELSDQCRAFQSSGWTIVLVAVERVIVAVAAIGDPLRPQTQPTIHELQRQGWQVGILSGDHPAAVEKVARQAGLTATQTHGDISPEEKLRIVQSCPADVVCVMVGDGVNDSAALAASSVGIAVEGGAAASLQAADIYLSRPGLQGILELTRGARQTVRTIHFNFAASLGYNLLAAGLAMSGQINPLIAAILMPVSSLTVLSIALMNPAFPREAK